MSYLACGFRIECGMTGIENQASKIGHFSVPSVANFLDFYCAAWGQEIQPFADDLGFQDCPSRPAVKL